MRTRLYNMEHEATRSSKRSEKEVRIDIGQVIIDTECREYFQLLLSIRENQMLRSLKHRLRRLNRFGIVVVKE